MAHMNIIGPQLSGLGLLTKMVVSIIRDAKRLALIRGKLKSEPLTHPKLSRRVKALGLRLQKNCA